MKLTIYCPEKEEIEPVEITETGECSIGRVNHHSNLIVIQGNIVPKSPRVIAKGHKSIEIGKHLEILVAASAITLNDNKTSNGSFLNGEKFVSRYIHRSGEYILKLGNVKFKLEYNL